MEKILTLPLRYFGIILNGQKYDVFTSGLGVGKIHIQEVKSELHSKLYALYPLGPTLQLIFFSSVIPVPSHQIELSCSIDMMRSMWSSMCSAYGTYNPIDSIIL